MPWIIDKDHVGEHTAKPGTNLNAVGLTGPGGYKGDSRELTVKFRMRDDDNELYYEGRAHEEYFGPLDDFGTPNAGATTIQYLDEKGEWKDL